MKITDKDRERNDMKKLLCFFLTVLCISLSGCGSGNAYNDTEILVNEARTCSLMDGEQEKREEKMDKVGERK